MCGDIQSLWEEETGLTTIEYALLLSLVAVAALAAWRLLGDRVSTTVDTSNTAIAAN